MDEHTPYLTCSYNLGSGDVYPVTSGKENAAKFLMRRLGAQPAHCRVLLDDDNDLRECCTCQSHMSLDLSGLCPEQSG